NKSSSAVLPSAKYPADRTLDEQQNIFSASVSLIGCSSRLDVFQMPCRTQSCGRCGQDLPSD
ncbi:MAG TPA: hypothetical protein VHQ93_10415, partial [Chitinophagaceae bacterium]|nr:hypothetical protein [Chitinophagaceae bacterium]